MLLQRKYRPTSHEAFTHRDIDSYAYDWERVANPEIAPKRPLKVYLPQTTGDVVAAIKEVKQLGERLVVRSKGHSSNDLVLNAGGAVLCTEFLNKILGIQGETVTVQAGAVLAEVDAHLGTLHYGLPVIGDHNDITAGGFASVGGVSPASHREGLFVDNVHAIEYVDWDGAVHTCTRKDHEATLLKILGGTGRLGVIVTLTIRILPIDKRATILRNERRITRKLETFIEISRQNIDRTDGGVMERGLWLDLPVLGKPFRVGQFSAYWNTEQSRWKSFRNRLAHGWLHTIGYYGGRLPPMIDQLLQYIGVLGIVLAPRYASMKNVESFADSVLDSTVGDPSRMFIVFAPAHEYEDMFRMLYDLCLAYRSEHQCFTYISMYVKGLDSPYLARGTDTKFCEVVLWLGIDPSRFTDRVLNPFVATIDQYCMARGAFRYMHTRTSRDEELRTAVDPNSHYRGQTAQPARAWRASATG